MVAADDRAPSAEGQREHATGRETERTPDAAAGPGDAEAFAREEADEVVSARAAVLHRGRERADEGPPPSRRHVGAAVGEVRRGVFFFKQKTAYEIDM